MSGQLDSRRLIVVGDGITALSAALEAAEAGVDVILVADTEHPLVRDVAAHTGLVVEYGRPVEGVEAVEGGVVVVVGDDRLVAHGVVLAPSRLVETSTPGDGNVHEGLGGFDPWDCDVLVVGGDDTAVDAVLRLEAEGARVVLALGGTPLSRLSRLARRTLFRLEAERRVTILWRSKPDSIEQVGGHPMAFFDDRRTPDLQFDHVVVVRPSIAACGPVGTSSVPGRVFCVGGPAGAGVTVVEPAEVWERVRAEIFPTLPAPVERPRAWRPGDLEQIEELRRRHYNATITYFDRAHSDLWVLRVRPDHGDTDHQAGQYASLGLGYWEPRIDTAQDPRLGERWDKMIRRSYSISSPIFDEHGYLADPHRTEELEFYIVLVPPANGRIPALTPRLALKRPGDRIYLGPRIAGRYVLDPVTDPWSQVVFLASGTGEAPHNAMIVELLRKGHLGAIVSVVSVRYRADLGYLDRHRELERRYPHYHYLPLTTREPDAPADDRLHIQDVIERDLLAERFGVELDPERTHVFLCGNPKMIGLPAWDGDRPRFPDDRGVCELLVGRGFRLDRRAERGNVHYEEYW